jgi:hypothetical protein
MLKSPKTVAGRILRKTTALLMAYCFLATSTWSLNPPGPGLSRRSSFGRTSFLAFRNPLAGLASAAAGKYSPALGDNQRMPVPKIFTNLADLHASMAAVQGTGGATATVSFFGPQEYVRTTGDPNTYTTTVLVPAWVANPFNLHIQSGEADGSFRVSSATVSINNVAVAVPADFNQNVFTLDRSVTLTPQTTLTVTLASKPGSYLRINLSGASGDHTSPAVTITAPAAAINTPQAHFSIRYQDIPGSGETSASGVNTATLKVLIDGVDRTSLFTRFSDEASGDLPASLALAQGQHNVSASIQDNAGNTGQATALFQVDTTAPSLQIQQPATGSYQGTTTPQIVLAYSDNFSLNTASLKITDNGNDITTSFSKTTTGASASPSLSQGGHEIVATLNDQAGNPAQARVSFNVDTTPPTIKIVHPSPGSKHGSSDLEYQIQYGDDQAIDLNSLVVTVDGNLIAVTPAATGVSGTVTLANSASHVLSATIKDKAGNPASDSSPFIVDTTVPNIHIVQPALNAILNNPTPAFQVQYDDPISGVDTQSFKALVDGTDVTALFNVGASSAAATLQTPLADGSHTLSAQISSGAGVLGSSSNPILIDTIKPQVSIISPVGPVNTISPLGLANYSDSGSGINPTSVRITVDGVDVTNAFGISSTSASGALGATAGLSEGSHQFAVQVSDKAGNLKQASSSFLVDVTPPLVAFTTPVNDSFINNTHPSFTLTYSDSGSGVDTSSIHVFLQQGTAPESEISSLFSFTAGQGTATIPASSPLVQGTYHLRAVVADKAGNSTPAQSSFAVDTTPPTYSIVSPAANAFLNSATPAFSVNYQDDSSGVDTSKFVLLVDGVDRTNRLTLTPTGASGSLQSSDALTEGTHQISATVVDRAGNAAPVVPQSFLVDTIAPLMSITAPTAPAFINNNRPPIAITYSDGGSGIDVTTFQLSIDGVDHTPEFTVSLTGASGTPLTALLDGPHSITATIKDLAGNPATTNSFFTVDTTPLTLTLAQPVDATFTNANSIAVSGSVTGLAPITLTIEGVQVPVAGNSFTSDVPLGPGPSQIIHVAASDPSGASTSRTVTVNIDRVSPTIVGSISPPPNAASWNNTNLIVSFYCADDRSGVASCTGPVPVATEGAHQIVTGTAIDKAGNTASTSISVNIDKTPPFITATTAPPPNANGWNNSNVSVSFLCTDSLSGIASCPSPTVVAIEGANQILSGQATDNAGNTAQASGFSLNIDKTPPTILQLSTPDHISNVHGGQVSVTVNDNFTVAQVVISVNGTSLGTFTSAPYQANLQVPSGAKPGDTLTVTVVATDEAGNTQTTSRGVSVTADGVIVGQVLSDTTGLPIQGATVQLISATGLIDQSDAKGRYSFQASDSHLFVAATNSGSTTVQREIFVQPGAGTVAVDARLTPLAQPTSMGSAGGKLTAGAISITIPSAAVSDGTTFQLTPLSGQGLPGLLPLGWSPLAAFDLRASSSVTGLPAVVSKLPAVTAHLAIYDPALHAWTLVASNLVSSGGACSFTVPALGAYALVVPDTTTPPIPVPDPGSPLSGIAVQALDPAASSSGTLNPSILPPAGGTAAATLGVQSPSFAPSGTLIQANVSETFSLASGDVVSEESRTEDILLYNALAPANSTMGALFPVTPSHQYTLTQLLTGKVHLDLLAGREGVRGQPGGNDALTLSDGTSTLSVPGGALSQDTAISVQSTSLENFIPTSSSLGAIQEVLVDFSGEVLNTPAQLSISSSGLNPADTFLLTQVQRINGVPHIVTVALAQVNGPNLSSVASPGLPGVTQGGEYVFYDISVPVGFVQGVTSSTAGPVSALVLTDSLPIAGISGADGHYIVPALVGPANLKASAPNTSLAGAASAQIIAGQTAIVNILLAGTVTQATVTPADGTLGVSTSTIITITTSAALNPQSVVQGKLSLVQGPASAPGAPVPLQPFILSTAGATLTFAPVSNLDPATQYTIHVSGLADVSGGAISVPVSSFTTKASAPLNFDPNAITFAMPDQNGNIHVSAPAGSLPPGTQVLIIDQGNAVVVSFTVLNDGSLSGDFPGTINDVLQVTVTSPNGATASFTRSQFVAADGSVAVGPGGGTVTGPGGVELRIPAGALDKGATFKIELVGPGVFPERPDLIGATFGSGLKISSPDQPNFKQEVRLAFPMPADAPPGAFFQVYRKLIGSNNQYAFEDVDYAKVEASTGKVVTASFPYRGLIDFNVKVNDALFQGQQLGGALGGGAVAGGLDSVAILMWTIDQLLPAVSLGGVITGRVRYAVPPGGAEPDGSINRTGDTVFAGVPNVVVRVDLNNSTHNLGIGQTVAMTQSDGTFTFSDPTYRGGTVSIVASDGAGHSSTGTAVEVVSLTDVTVDQFAGPLLKLYRNVAFADIVVPAPAPPPPTPKIAISFFTENQNSTPVGLRVPVSGIVASGTPLVIVFKTNGQIPSPPSVRINNTSYAVQADQPTVSGDPNAQDYELSQPFMPGAPGIYTLTVTGLTPFLQTITASKSFLVIAPGGSNNTINVGTAPIIASVTPQAGSIGVPVNTLVQVQFSEPVTNLPGHVSLLTDDGSPSPALKLSGIDYRDGVTVISNLSSKDGVASLTIEPSDLKFGTHYTLQITSDVVDLDNVSDPTKPALPLVQPQNQNPPQVPYDFTTFGPTVLGSTGTAGTSRPVVFGNRAYVAVPKAGVFSELDTYDVSDPTNPQPIPSAIAMFAGRAMDLAGEQTAAVINNGSLLAVGSGYASSEILMPSNLWLYDVSTDVITRVAGISVTSSAVNVGQILRVALHGNFAYTSTYPLGISVVDLQQGITEYKNTDPTTFGVQVTTDGEGFATDAVVNTIPVRDANGRNVTLLGIQANDYLIAGSDPQNPITQTLVVATGSAPGPVTPNPVSFVVADPTQPGNSALLFSGQLQFGNFSLTAGVALALGQININDANGNPVPQQLAVVVGRGLAPDPASPGQTTTNVMAVVDMTVPSAPKVLSLQGLAAAASDVILNNNLAIVAEGTKAELFDLTDPANPFQTGSIDGIGGMLALNGFLFSAGFSTPGLHVAALGALAFVKSFDPKVIVVSPANELFDNVNINFGIIPPDPNITTAEVHIDVQSGARTATLPATVSTGSGSVIWPSGAVVSPTNAYFATVHASAHGAELPTTQVRVPLLGVPIAVAPRDRMLRIQFALPDQQLFVDAKGNPIDKYSVNVYLNGDGSGSPAFSVSSTQIANAYVNTDAWFSTAPDGTGVPIQDGSTLGTQAWVTRKIDKFAVPIGLISPIRMQAFEIGTVLAQPSAIFIKVISEKTGKLVAKLMATPSTDSNWSQIIDKVAGYVDENPTPTQIVIAGILDNAGMIFRALEILDEASTEFTFGVLQGLLDGFKDGVQGDVSMVGSIFDAAVHPVKTAQALYQFLGKVVKALGQINFLQAAKSLFSSASWPSLNDAILLAGKGGYFLGYLCGFIVEQVLSAVLLALVSEGIGAVAEKVLALLKGVAWIAELAADAAKILRVMGYWMEVLAQTAADSTTAKAVLGFLRDSKAAVVALTDKYPAADKVLKKLAQTWQLSSKLAGKTMEWLNIINKMKDEAAEGLVTFILNKGETDSEALMSRWLGLSNGKRSVADAAEAYSGFANLSEGSADALVTAAEEVNTDSIKYTKSYADKYKAASGGDRVGSSLSRLRAVPGDVKYTDEAIGDAVKLNSDVAVIEMSDDAIEETAAIESHVPCTTIASLAPFSIPVPSPCGKTVLEDLYAAFGADSTLGPRFKVGLEKLKSLNDPELEKTLGNLAGAAKYDPDVYASLVRAISIDGFSAEGTAEYLKALDKMRDADGNIITGLLDASPTDSATINIKRVGNVGAGSIAEAYEPVAAQRMINDGQLSVTNIQEFGRKINVSDLGVSRQSIEADCFLKDGTFIDMKHSALNDPFIDRGQLSAVTAALAKNDGRISRALYVVSSDLDNATKAAITQANANLDALLGPSASPRISFIVKGPPLQ